MVIVKRILLAILLLDSLFAVAAGGGAIKQDRFSTRDGLIHNRVNALFQQENGHLWIGTQGGLCRFDGSGFDDMAAYPNLPQGAILKLAGDNAGAIWILTDQKLARFQNDGFETVYVGKRDLETFTVDAQQRVWIGSKRGITLIEGTSVRELGAESNISATRVKFIFQDSSERIWVGLRPGGLALYEESEARFSVFTTADGLPHETVNAIHESGRDGQLWVATHGGLAYLDQHGFRPTAFNDALQSPLVLNIVEDAFGVLWFNMPSGGVTRWDGLNLATKSATDGLAGNNVTSMHCDIRGRLWFFANRGIAIYENDNLQTVDLEEQISSSLITCFHEGGDGLLWVGTSTGFYRFEDERLITRVSDPTDQRLPTGSVAREIVTDSRGHLWFPSLAGLGYYNHKNFRLFTELSGLPDNRVHHFCEDLSGRIWVGTEQGIAVGDSFGFKPLTQVGLKGRAAVALAADSRGRVWILDRDWQLWRNEGDSSLEFRAMGLFEGAVDLKTADGVLWVTSSEALYRYEDTLQMIKLTELLPGKELMRHFHEGVWWFGVGNDLYRYDGFAALAVDVPGTDQAARMFIMPGGAYWLVVALPGQNFFTRAQPIAVIYYNGRGFQRFEVGDGLLSADIKAVFPDPSGGFWLATDKGLSRYREGTFNHLMVRDGLAGNQPADLLRDSRGNLWIATNGGLNKHREYPWTLEQGQDVGSGLLTTFSQRDGLLDPVVLGIALDRAENLWIRTRSGVQQFRESQMRPNIRMAAFVNGQRVLPGDDVAKMPHYRNNLLFRLSNIYLRRGTEQTHFAYSLRLNGTEETAPVITRESEIRFANLKPGSYTFEVAAYDRDLYGSDPLRFQFRILAPFWFQPWFLVVGILTGLLLSYAFYRKRLRDNLEKARVLNELQKAHRMQIGLMPTHAPDLKGIDLFGTCEPAQEVGGDFFDYFWLDDEERQLGFTVMDVSGKSMEAAIISVLASGLVYSEVGSGNTPEVIFSKINYAMFKKTDKKVFTTGLLGALDLSRRKLVWANAGHMDPILIRDGKQLDLPQPARRNLPLGARPRTSYNHHELKLQSGDLWLFYTDGLSEAADSPTPPVRRRPCCRLPGSPP